MSSVDVLFISQILAPRDTGDPTVYKPLRLELHNQVASFPVLRALASPDPQAAFQHLAHIRTTMGTSPVLTGPFLKDHMARLGLNLLEIPCLETGMDTVHAAIANGVRLIALSTTWLPGSHGATLIRNAAQRLKAAAPGIPIVAGGVGVRKGLRARKLLQEGKLSGMSPDEVAEHYFLIDASRDLDLEALIVSEGGENTLAAIARRLAENRDFRDLPNLAIPKPSGYHFNSTVPETSDIDGGIVDWRQHTDRLKHFEAPIRTAMGCPFRCEFCDFMGLYEPRLRSVDSLISELSTLSAAMPAPRRVFFTDDNLAVTRNRITQFTRALVKANLGLTWRAFIRADAIDEEAAALMAESGCRECLVGIESGDPTVLHNMRKHLDPEKALRAITLLDRHGIGTQCTFLVGFPGECAASIQNTADLISSMPSGNSARAIHRYYMFRFEVVPLCPAAAPERREEFGLKGTGETWSHNTMDSTEAGHAMRTIFERVSGPSHLYLEHFPPEWPVTETRRIMEFRDAFQKNRLKQLPDDGGAALLNLVRQADQQAARPDRIG